MSNSLVLERLTIGVGRHFAHQAKVQLHAFQLAAMQGVSAFFARHPDRDLLKANEAIVAKNVTENLYDWHLKPLFMDGV